MRTKTTTKTHTYIKPHDCHSPKAHWTLVLVLEEAAAGGCAMALGRWDGQPRLGMRWNGSAAVGPIGNPQSRGLPTWFLVPPGTEQLLLPLVKDKKLRALADEFLEDAGAGGRRAG